MSNFHSIPGRSPWSSMLHTESAMSPSPSQQYNYSDSVFDIYSDLTERIKTFLHSHQKKSYGWEKYILADGGDPVLSRPSLMVSIESSFVSELSIILEMTEKVRGQLQKHNHQLQNSISNEFRQKEQIRGLQEQIQVDKAVAMRTYHHYREAFVAKKDDKTCIEALTKKNEELTKKNEELIEKSNMDDELLGTLRTDVFLLKEDEKK